MNKDKLQEFINKLKQAKKKEHKKIGLADDSGSSLNKLRRDWEERHGKKL